MRLSVAQYAVWLAGPGVEGVLVCALARRQLMGRMPVFFVYVAFYLLREVVDFLVWHAWPRTYYQVYWTGQVIGFGLSYLLIFDLWKRGLRAYPGIWHISRWVFGFACLGLVGVVSATTEFGQGAAPQAGQWINDWMRLLSRSVLFTQATFLFAFFLVLGFFRVRVTSLVRGLALSWFGYSIVAIALYSLRYFFGPAIQATYSLVLPFCFLVLLVAWTGVIWTSPAEEDVEVAPVFPFAARQRQALLERMELLNNSLLRILQG